MERQFQFTTLAASVCLRSRTRTAGVSLLRASLIENPWVHDPPGKPLAFAGRSTDGWGAPWR
jgi:hypothetical protein